MRESSLFFTLLPTSNQSCEFSLLSIFFLATALVETHLAFLSLLQLNPFTPPQWRTQPGQSQCPLTSVARVDQTIFRQCRLVLIISRASQKIRTWMDLAATFIILLRVLFVKFCSSHRVSRYHIAHSPPENAPSHLFPSPFKFPHPI